jgi:poly-gamma-glutamate synthesis protein (capsule biosynthesis protein)
MKQILILLFLLTTFLLSEFHSSIEHISPEIKKRMIEGNSWREGCPVGLENLRYIQVSYHDYEGKTQVGELIMHKKAANEIVAIMKDLYEMDYPIYQMGLVSDFGADDYRSIEADNTSAFNCREVTGGKKWSKHAYGLAIDINPIENPYLKKGRHSSHGKSLKFEKRVHQNNLGAQDHALLLKKDKATQSFIKRGWVWGGDWKYLKDYQHFQKKLPSSSKKNSNKAIEDLF